MTKDFNIEIISPDEKIFAGKSEEVILPCYEGQVTILRDHIPLITFLRPGLIIVGNDSKFFVEEGTVEFSENNLLILSNSVKNLKNIKNEEISEMIKDSEKKISNNQVSDKQRYILSYKIETLKNIN